MKLYPRDLVQCLGQVAEVEKVLDEDRYAVLWLASGLRSEVQGDLLSRAPSPPIPEDLFVTGDLVRFNPGHHVPPDTLLRVAEAKEEASPPPWNPRFQQRLTLEIVEQGSYTGNLNLPDHWTPTKWVSGVFNTAIVLVRRGWNMPARKEDPQPK